MDASALLRAALVAGAVVALVGVALIVLVMWRYRIPPRGVVAMGTALVYLLSPVDLVPEALLGPLGLVDDAGVLAGTVFFVYRLVRARRVLADAGVPLPGRLGRETTGEADDP